MDEERVAYEEGRVLVVEDDAHVAHRGRSLEAGDEGVRLVDRHVLQGHALGDVRGGEDVLGAGLGHPQDEATAVLQTVERVVGTSGGHGRRVAGRLPELKLTHVDHPSLVADAYVLCAHVARMCSAYDFIMVQQIAASAC